MPKQIDVLRDEQIIWSVSSVERRCDKIADAVAENPETRRLTDIIAVRRPRDPEPQPSPSPGTA